MLDKPLYTMAEAARILHVSKGDIYRLHHAGLLRCLKLGSLKVRAEELERFLRDAEGKDVTDPFNVKDIAIEKAPR